ncbi:hypothetical protein OXX69_005473 [Metschnikowia pulcherrima]
MASPVRNVAARYLDSLPESSPARAPLAQATKFNIQQSPSKTVKSPKKLESPDLDDLARQMNIETPARKTDLLRSRYETPSATVSMFKTTPSTRNSASKARNESVKKYTNVPVEPLSASRNRSLSDTKAYEYLCRIQAIKNWLEAVLAEEIPQSPAELISHVQNGIYLAKLANVFLPAKKPVYMQDARLEFRHTENINRFFKLLKYLDIPDVFQFELTDLYDAKDVPKVWFCLHAISYKINTLNPDFPAMENLVGTLDFSSSDIKTASRALLGHTLPNFSSADNADVASPGTNAYMNKALSVASPVKSPVKPAHKSFSLDAKSGSIVDTENPFLVKNTPSLAPSSASTFRLNSVKMPDLSARQADLASTSSHITTDTSETYHTAAIDEHEANIVKLQALCKGSLLRYNMFVRKIMLKSYDTELTTLFAIMRGNMARARSVHRHRDEIRFFGDEILRLQSIARMRLSQKSSRHVSLSAEKDTVQALQHVIRGSLVRREIARKRRSLEEFSDLLTSFQSRVRAKAIFTKISPLIENRESIEHSVVQVQSIARRALYKSSQDKGIISHLRSDRGLIELQTLIRGAQARNHVRRDLWVLMAETAPVTELQSIARGAITRTRLCNNVLITLMGEDINMNRLFAKARGNFARDEVAYKKAVLQYVEQSQIVPIQSAFRGILLRFNKSVDMEDIYENVNSIIILQAKVRANSVKSEFRAVDHHYNSQVEKVIKAQAILRSKYTQDAYKAFVMMQNPPVDVVRKFAYLLSDSGPDYEEELELTRLKDEIMDKSRNNEDLEAQIENLDIKLSLLDKNKITIEDFMKHNNKFKTHKPIQQSAGARRSLEGLNKSAKKRIEIYSSMLYFLQTNPAYLLRLYESMSPQDAGKMLKSLHSLVTQIFSFSKITANSNSREEYFFMKFVCALMASDIQTRAQNIADITKLKSTFWITHLLEFNNQTHQRSFLKKQFGPVVERIIEDDEVTFESNPSKIYHLMRAQEINVYGQSDRLENVTPQTAIKDEKVSAQFVQNLMALRDTTSEVMESLRHGVAKLPIHMRIVAKEAYKLSHAHFPEHNEQSHLSVAGVVVIKHYIASIMQYPENFGYSTKDPIAADGVYPDRIGDNLKYLSRVLLQVFSMKAFSDNFMKPLNDFVLSYVDSTKAIVRDIINVSDLDVEYEMNAYDDLVSHDRPQLTMKVSDMIATEKIVSRHIDIVTRGNDDQLITIFTELNDLVNSANDFVTLTEIGSLTITLSPSTSESSAADSKTKNLISQAKRCLLYIIRVQDGDDLLELFVRGIKPSHEEKFREIIEAETAEKSQKRGITPYGRSSLGDLSGMSYVNLKKLALQVILQLEKLGVVTRKDSFQALLNEVVSDIKTKDSRRKSRKSQLLIAGQTVTKLLEKEVFLKRQLNDYNKHIDGVLMDLQRRPKDKKIFNVIPVFSKQYFYHRQLKKNNRLPKFGSYKYSAKKLMEQGVVKDIGGALHRKAASSSKVELMFSCHKAGVFVIEAANGTVNIPGACNTITLDKVLDHQYERKAQWVMFDGMVTFDTENLAALIFRHFYDIRKD